MTDRDFLFYIRKCRFRALSSVAFICLLASMYWLHNQNDITSLFRSFAEMALSLGLLGYVLLIVMQFVVSMTGVLPASLLAIMAGGLYGVVGGFTVSFIGLLAAASCAFWMSRSLLRNWVSDHIRDRGILNKLDSDIVKGRWKAVLLLRVSPVSPFGVTSYALGLTSIRFWDYLIGTCASSFSLIVYVYSGNLIGRAILAEGVNTNIPIWVEWFFLLLGFGAMVAFGLYIKSIFKWKRYN